MSKALNDLIDECPVCYENYSLSSNYCITECKHSFCLKCILTYSKINNSCPICRAQLDDKIIEDTGDDDSSYGGSDDDSDDDYRRDLDSGDECSVEYLTNVLQKKGYTMLDIVSIYTSRFSINDSKYTEQYCTDLYKNIRKTVNDLDDDTVEENEEIKLMKLEDKTIQ